MSETAPHDTGYKLLFSHPEMVRDLLTGYMPGAWLAQANFSTLERVNASYVSESERQRHDDMVWRLKVGEQWVWVYLILEFQSEPDPWMALRMMVYVGLLAQHLVREGELHHGLLPPVVPIVLYNGATPWKAHTDVADCFGPSLPGLELYRPRLLYHLVDEARLKLHPMTEVRNLAEALFRLERSRTPPDIFEVMRALWVPCCKARRCSRCAARLRSGCVCCCVARRHGLTLQKLTTLTTYWRLTPCWNKRLNAGSMRLP